MKVTHVTREVGVLNVPPPCIVIELDPDEAHALQWVISEADYMGISSSSGLAQRGLTIVGELERLLDAVP